MNSENPVQFIQKGFHVTIGATSFLIETLQDPQKRDENLAKLSGDFNVLSEEWSVEGAKKEQEARQFVESLMGDQAGSMSGFSNGSEDGSASSSATTPVNVPAEMYRDLQELTTQLTALRSDIEQMNNPD